MRSEYLVCQIQWDDIRLPPYDSSYSEDDTAPEPEGEKDGGIGFYTIGAELEDRRTSFVVERRPGVHICSCQCSSCDGWDRNVLPERICNLEFSGSKTALNSGMSSWNKGIECARIRMGQ